MESILLTEDVIAKLHQRGVNTLWKPNSTVLPIKCRFEPPCSIKWMSMVYSCTLGAFSYAVSGYFFAVTIGRYVSIGESVQMGRSDHPLNWLSTSAAQYLQRDEFFDVGYDFPGGEKLAKTPHFGTAVTTPPMKIKPITVGHDVWIGHGAYIRPGTTIGNGAIIGGHAVVTRDVPPYAIVAGNPARVRRMRFPDPIIERLQALQWWQYPIWDLKGIKFDKIERAINEVEERVDKGLLTPYEPGFIELASLVEK